MEIKIVSPTKVICSNRNSIFNYFAWPSVTRLPGGELAMVSSGFRMKHVCPFGKSIICYSRNEGESWTKPAVVMDTPLDDRDSGIVSFGKNKVMITSFNNDGEQQRQWNKSAREGDYEKLSRGKPSEVTDYVSHRAYDLIDAYINCVDYDKAEQKFLGSVYTVSDDGGYTFGEIKKAPVTCPHGPALMPDGSLIYVGVVMENKNHLKIIRACKTDGNGEFVPLGEIEIPERIEGISVMWAEPSTVVMPDGKIIVQIRVESRHSEKTMENLFTVYQSVSEDGGKTFSLPKPISSNPRLGAPAHLLCTKDGTLISALSVRNEESAIRIIVSSDGGDTWQEAGDIMADENIWDMGYPCSVELSNGDILTVFYSHKDAGAPAEIMQVVWRLE